VEWSASDAKAGAGAAAHCSNATIRGGSNVATLTYRFVLKGHVTCAEAHRTMRAYVRALVAGRCPTRICTQVLFPGGWTCSATSTVEQRAGSPLGGCDRRNASFQVFSAARRTR